MLTTILLVVAILAVGAQLADTVRVRQEEAILRKLPEAEAHAYYEVLRQRVRRVRLLRAITLASLVLVMLGARRRFFPPPPPKASAPAVAERPTNTDAARALAEVELRRYAARERLDPTGIVLVDVGGDDRHPWVFRYRHPGSADRLEVYVDRAGRVELHRVAAP